MSLILRAGAPYIAVAVCWCLLENAWLTLLVYHAQVLFWSGRDIPNLIRGWDRKLFFTTGLPMMASGPLAYFLLPLMTVESDLAGWLGRFGLSGIGLAFMVPYFGFVHPLLEQVHWSSLRSRGWPLHAAFAGYHALVLCSLLQPIWLLFCVAMLFLASALWSLIQSRTRSGLLVPACGHVLADLGIVLAAWVIAT